MILFLLCAVAGVGTTGWMLTLDAFWGNATVEDLHVRLVDTMIVAIVVHVGANIYGSLRHRENLIGAMVTGRKRAPNAPVPGPESERTLVGRRNRRPREERAMITFTSGQRWAHSRWP